jgi:serine protease SohB
MMKTMEFFSNPVRGLIERFRDPPPVVSVPGIIGRLGSLKRGLSLAGQASLIERAFKVRRLSAVALAVNSPGGSPVQVALIATRIRTLADEKGVPVFAFAENVAASGGYWLALAADENSITGSIGVISAGFGFPGLLERLGIERRLHTAGARKG